MWIETTNFTLRLWPLEFAELRWRPRRMMRHAWQRWTRGFDDTELWCLDWTIARFVLPRLVAFRAMGKVGCPPEFCGADASDEAIERGEAEFMAIVDKMIYAFECRVHEEKDLPPFTWEPAMVEGYEGVRVTNYEAYRVANAAREARIQEGLGLFAKYMHCLWD